jgi:hypothetical protein
MIPRSLGYSLALILYATCVQSAPSASVVETNCFITSSSWIPADKAGKD